MQRLQLVFFVIRIAATVTFGVAAIEDAVGDFAGPPGLLWGRLAMFTCLVVCIWWPRIGALLSLPLAALSLYAEHYEYVVLCAPLAAFATLVAKHYWYSVAAASSAVAVGVAAWLMPPHRSEALWLIVAFTLVGSGLGAVVAVMLESHRRVAAIAQAQLDLQQLSAADSRRRVADALHDNIGHALTVSSRVAEAFASDAEPGTAAALEQIRLAAVEGSRHLSAAVALLREETHGSTLNAHTTTALLAFMAAKLRTCGYEVTVDADEWFDQLFTDPRARVRRVITEATTNVLKHAARGASVRYECRLTPSSYYVSVSNTIAARREPSEALAPSGLAALRVEALENDADLTWGFSGTTFTVSLVGNLEDLSALIPGGWLQLPDLDHESESIDVPPR